MAADENGRRAPSQPKSIWGISSWYTKLTTRRVDLVGDFAGGERFFIHGDGLVLHCMLQGAVSIYDSDFQLLHLVYEVEKLLTALIERGCNFDIIFFDEFRDLLSREDMGRYDIGEKTANFAVNIVREHLKRCFSSEKREGSRTSDGAAASCHVAVRVFDSPFSREFGAYLQQRNIRFALCHDGHTAYNSYDDTEDEYSGDESEDAEDEDEDDASDPQSLEPIVQKSDDQEDSTEEETFFSDEDEYFTSIEGYCCLKTVIFAMVTKGYPVAVINDISFHSSKVFVDLIAGSYSKEGLGAYVSAGPDSEDSDEESRARWQDTLVMRQVMKCSAVKENLNGPLQERITAREAIALKIVRGLLDSSALRMPYWYGICSDRGIPRTHLSYGSEPSSSDDDEDEDGDSFSWQKHGIPVLLLHFAALRELSLTERSLFLRPRSSDYQDKLNFVIHAFDWRLAEENEDVKQLAWDLYDCIDGKLLDWILESRSLWGKFPPAVHTRAHLLVDLATEGLKDARDDLHKYLNAHKPFPPCEEDYKFRQETSVLPFSHPVLDRHLESVHIDTTATAVIDEASAKTFRELTHWHNRKQIDPRKIPFKRGFFASKRHQKLMADIVAYTASLTGSNGKVLDPEPVVVSAGAQNHKAAKQPKHQDQHQSKKAKTEKSAGGSGTAKALESAMATNQKKLEKKNESAFVHWKSLVTSLENEDNLVQRYHKTLKYLNSCSVDALATVEPEARLYLCNSLWLMWEMYCDNSRKPSGIDLVAMFWDQILRLSKIDGHTAQINKAARNLTALMGLPLKLPVLKSPSRELLFDIELEPSLKYRIPTDPWAFQLQHSGPYMKRDFDSQPDPRVTTFRPDAWQREVLDAVDANQSLFVVAPTSAGKTFISFYAMKKVLQSNDDDVLVYVAPTKALVNQIAAEISARYTKSYRGEGKSVWAIHTRDYRINNPTGCQILVTVPHILQIMLLSPSNCDKPTAWSRRVKRIIFDEVHCIGQADDGIIWEQLLLLAPCPIIALSATVGNADEFCEWLKASQAQKGHELKMVVHGARYSDLRKFLYIPSAVTPKALVKHDRLPVPGLDQGVQPSKDFAFVHPIAALVDFTNSTLRDVSLEPRDCYTLWEAMTKLQSEVAVLPMSKELDPKTFLPSIPGKADIFRWEAALKDVLAQWMMSSSTAIEQLRKELLGPRLSAIVGDADDFKHGSVDDLSGNIVPLLYSLYEQDSLPALVFNYDRLNCEKGVKIVMAYLMNQEAEYKMGSKDWTWKMEEYTRWQRAAAKAAKTDKSRDDVKISKMEKARTEASVESSPWESFDPTAPLDQFSFADKTVMSNAELNELLESMSTDMVAPWLMEALKRGLGVHHAGLNRRYRQIVEILFRKKYLKVVIATGTLALGINMPCKTVVFSGDSVFLTALNYRQASGRAGRRGFDLLGNVVFTNISPARVFEIMSSHLPDLKGQFPSSTTLVLRLLSLLHGTNQSQFAVDAVNSLLSQTRLYLGGPQAQMAIKHHLRFSIEYLRRQHLISENGTPLNFSGLVSHLYFTENAAFAFHALLKGGYFHHLCSTFKQRRSAVLLELMLVLSHLFGRQPIRESTAKYMKQVIVGKSPSVVLLPALPPKARRIIQKHNGQTLGMFKTYVRSFISQHLQNEPDDMLPLSKHRITGRQDDDKNRGDLENLSVIRSPFVMLSGFEDWGICSIRNLCGTVRAGVFLEESTIPYIPVHKVVDLNAYLYDFFKHGDLKALTRDNRIRGGDVWFLLKDFSLVLATIVTSLSNYMRADGAEEDAAMLDEADEEDEELVRRHAKQKQKAPPLEDWFDEEDHDALTGDDADVGGKQRCAGVSQSRFGGTAAGRKQAREESLVNVLEAFTELKEDFDEKFRKIGA